MCAEHMIAQRVRPNDAQDEGRRNEHEQAAIVACRSRRAVLQKKRERENYKNPCSSFADRPTYGRLDEVWNRLLYVHSVWMVDRPNENKISVSPPEARL